MKMYQFNKVIDGWTVKCKISPTGYYYVNFSAEKDDKCYFEIVSLSSNEGKDLTDKISKVILEEQYRLADIWDDKVKKSKERYEKEIVPLLKKIKDLGFKIEVTEYDDGPIVGITDLESDCAYKIDNFEEVFE